MSESLKQRSRRIGKMRVEDLVSSVIGLQEHVAQLTERIVVLEHRMHVVGRIVSIPNPFPRPGVEGDIANTGAITP